MADSLHSCLLQPLLVREQHEQLQLQQLSHSQSLHVDLWRKGLAIHTCPMPERCQQGLLARAQRGWLAALSLQQWRIISASGQACWGGQGGLRCCKWPARLQNWLGDGQRGRPPKRWLL